MRLEFENLSKFTGNYKFKDVVEILEVIKGKQVE